MAFKLQNYIQIVLDLLSAAPHHGHHDEGIRIPESER